MLPRIEHEHDPPPAHHSHQPHEIVRLVVGQGSQREATALEVSLGRGEFVEGIADQARDDLGDPLAEFVQLLEEIAYGLTYRWDQIALVSLPEAPRLGAEEPQRV